MVFSKKIDIYYFITLLFLLLSANASFLSVSNIAWFLIIVFMCLLAIGRKLLLPGDLKTIGLFSLVYLLFVSVRDFTINDLDVQFFISDVIFLFKFVFLSFIFCTILKEKAAAYIVTVITHLTILSFFFFSFQLLDLGEYIYKFSSALNLRYSHEFPGYTNFLFFTFIKGQDEYRNSGFVWEPGSFGCFLVIALLLNFFLNNFTFDKKSKILIIGIITTLSTTDYLALLILLFCAYRFKVPKINFWAIVIVLVSALIIIFLPILGDKISDTYYNDISDLNRLKTLEIFYQHNHMQIPLNRFASMVYIYNLFGFKLILGVSNKYDAILNRTFDINISNGIFDFLAKFGLVGFIFLIYHYSRFCLANVLKWEYLIYCILVLLLVGFGEPILFLPIILMFIFMPVVQTRLSKKVLGN